MGQLGNTIINGKLTVNGVVHAPNLNASTLGGKAESQLNVNWAEVSGKISDGTYSYTPTQIHDALANLNIIPNTVNVKVAPAKNNYRLAFLMPDSSNNSNIFAVNDIQVNVSSKTILAPNYTLSVGTLKGNITVSGQVENAAYAVSAGYANSAGEAAKLGTNAGSSSVPVYFSGGVPVQCSTTLDVNITGNIPYTWYPQKIQTQYTANTNFYGSSYPIYAKWVTNSICKWITDGHATATDYSMKLVDTSYNTLSVGSASLPVYFSGGVPVSITSGSTLNVNISGQASYATAIGNSSANLPYSTLKDAYDSLTDIVNGDSYVPIANYALSIGTAANNYSYSNISNIFSRVRTNEKYIMNIVDGSTSVAKAQYAESANMASVTQYIADLNWNYSYSYENLNEYITDFKNRLDNLENGGGSSNLTAGYGISISADGVISVNFADGDEGVY